MDPTKNPDAAELAQQITNNNQQMAETLTFDNSIDSGNAES